MTNLLFEPPFGGLRGKVRTSSIARWKARGQLLIRDIWTFFASSYGWDVISRYWSKTAHFRGGWVTLSANFRWKESSPFNHCWYQKTSVFATSQWRPHNPMLIRLDRVPACDGRTDRRTDRRNCCRYYSAPHCMQCGRAVKTERGQPCIVLSCVYSYPDK